MGRSEGNHPLSAPLPFAAMVACVIASFLALDHFANADEQLLLGAATWLILIASCASLGREDRARALLVVVVATCAEVLGSIVLGAYTYRLENLPAFVPPGHGLVFLAGLRISQSGLVRRHRRALPLGRDRPGRRLGSGGPDPPRPDRRARGDHRRAADLRPGARPLGHPLRRRLPDGRLPRDLRHVDRRLALGRDGTRHATPRGQPAERHRGRLRPLRRRCDRHGATRAGDVRPAAPAARCSPIRRSRRPPARRIAPSSTPSARSGRRGASATRLRPG